MSKDPDGDYSESSGFRKREWETIKEVKQISTLFMEELGNLKYGL